MQARYEVTNEQQLHELAADLVAGWGAGDLVLLDGPLGVGKTTFVRGVLLALGWQESVRSPSFNLIHVYPTEPAVMHADLYRVTSDAGIGWEEYLADHLCFMEWPDRIQDPSVAVRSWRITLEFGEGDSRIVTVHGPGK